MSARLHTRAAPRATMLLALLPLLTSACVEPDALDDPWASDAPLVELDTWEVLEARHDPLAAHRPETLSCPVAAWGIENDALEVQTGVCNYLALGQPIGRGVRAGERVELIMWHDALDAAEPGLGHFALTLAGEVIGEYEVEIPSPAAVVELNWTATEDVPRGAELGLHLHNHGYNSWTVVSIEAM